MSLILIIEDEKDILDLVEYHLKQAGFQVLTAADGGAGLDQRAHGRTAKKYPAALRVAIQKLVGQSV